MQKAVLIIVLFIVNTSIAQQSDFTNISFYKADKIAKSTKSKKISDLYSLTLNLTKNLDTEVEKVRAIYIWICHNIANDYRLYTLNDRKRKKLKEDSIRLDAWNSNFKKILFKKLIKKKKTICTGYAYLLKEMCSIIGVEAKMVNGFAKTSTVDLENISEPNHTWNIVKLNDKWYLCDPTWATGISYPEKNEFIFKYKDVYFLSDPKVFIYDHYPINKDFSLLDEIPTYSEFKEFPLIYSEAYNILQKHDAPKKMHQQIKKNTSFLFQYTLKKGIDKKKVKFIFVNGSSEKTIKPKLFLQKNTLQLKHTFKNRGFYDVHLYIEDKIIATYTFNVVK